MRLGDISADLDKFVREKELLALEDAIRKMTSLPVSRVGFRDRRILNLGVIADLVSFGPNMIKDIATYNNRIAILLAKIMYL